MSEAAPDTASLPQDGQEHRLHPLSWLFVLLAQLKQFILPLLVLLFGVVAALGVLNLGQVVTPLNTLLTQVASFLPNVIGAVLIFFIGFVVATLTYQVLASSEHARMLPMVALLATAALLGAYGVLRHVFYAGGMISVIIELVGGLVFLVHLLRKGLR